jgi:hypothetical protein
MSCNKGKPLNMIGLTCLIFLISCKEIVSTLICATRLPLQIGYSFTDADYTRSKSSYNTSKKHCKKEPQSFFHCGSIDHPDLQSLKRLHIISFYHSIYHWKGLENTFLAAYYVPNVF